MNVKCYYERWSMRDKKILIDGDNEIGDILILKMLYLIVWFSM